VAAVLPVTHPGLPADEKVNPRDLTDFMNTFARYMENTVNMLNQQPAGAFTPDLAKLDALVQSIDIE
jgi:hypothetical protein